MPAGADAVAGYVEPSTPNKYLDAEDTGRTQAGAPVLVERVKDVAANASLAAINAKLPASPAADGTDGAAPPGIPGTGIRGWLRSIYDRLNGTLAVGAVSLPLPAGAAKDSTLTDGSQRVGGTVAVSGPLTDTQLRATPVPVSGTVTATPTGTQDDNLKQVNGVAVNVGTGAAGTGTQRVAVSLDSFPASQAITAVSLPLPTGAAQEHATAVSPESVRLTDGAAFYKATTPADTQPVSGPLTDVQLRATPVPISGTVAATGPLTDTQLRASAVPVSGTLTDTQLRASAVPVSGPLTDAQLRASAVAVSGIVNPTTPAAVVAFLTAVPTAGTRVQLASNAVVAGILQAPSTNAGVIYVGAVTVSGSVFGAELQPGQATGIAIDNTNRIYIDASVSGDKCAFLGS